MKKKDILQIIKKAKQVLDSGGIILYPTDTIWGIGCDATNPKAISKIYSIKKRDEKKPLIILVHSMNVLLNYVKDIPKVIHDVIKKTDKPTTIIYNNPMNLPDNLIYNNTIAARMITHGNLKLLLKSFAKPITSTSANISGFKMGNSLVEIENSIKQKVDYIIPEEFKNFPHQQKPSRIIKIKKNSEIEIVRE